MSLGEAGVSVKREGGAGEQRREHEAGVGKEVTFVTNFFFEGNFAATKLEFRKIAAIILHSVAAAVARCGGVLRKKSTITS